MVGWRKKPQQQQLKNNLFVVAVGGVGCRCSPFDSFLLVVFSKKIKINFKLKKSKQHEIHFIKLSELE